MGDKIKCPVPVNGRECGREELLDNKRLIRRRPDSTATEVHHECGLHKFHIIFPGGEWKECDCPIT